MPYMGALKTRDINAALEKNTLSFLAQFLERFAGDRAWLIEITDSLQPQLKLYDIKLSEPSSNQQSFANSTPVSDALEDKAVASKLTALQAVSSMDCCARHFERDQDHLATQAVTIYNLDCKVEDFQRDYLTILQQIQGQCSQIPNKLLSILPDKLKARLADTRCYWVINGSRQRPVLLGVKAAKDEACKDHYSLSTVAQLCHLYRQSQRNIEELSDVCQIIDNLDIPILCYDFSRLVPFLELFKQANHGQVDQFITQHMVAIISAFDRLPLLYINQACFRLFKVSSLRAMKGLLRSSLQQAVLKLMSQLIQAIAHEAAYFNTQVTVHDAEQREIHLVLKFNIPKRRQEFSQITISLVDISEQKAVEKKIKESLLRYELVVLGSTGGIWDWDIPTKMVHYSPTWAAMRGYDISEISPHQDQWLDTMHPEDRSRVLQVVEEHFAGNTPCFQAEYRILRKDGSVRWVSDRGIAKRNENGDVIRMAGSEIDITDRKASDERLRLGSSVFENAAEGIMILNTQREIIDINCAFSELLGFSSEQVSGAKVANLLIDDSEQATEQAIWQSLAQEHKWQGEIQLSNSDGVKMPIWLTLSCVLDVNQQVTHYVGLMTDIGHVKKSEAMMYQLAHHDSLTGLPNRLLLNKRLENAIAHAGDREELLAIIFIDLDNFKFVNDGLGHAAGDQLLQGVAKTLTASLRSRDTVARIGGDEFVVILEDIGAAENVAKIACKVLADINRHITMIDREIRVSASMGIATYPHDGKDPDTLMSNADAAMYRAKAMGKNNFQFYTRELTKIAVERMELESNLFDALEHQQFVLHYQAQYNLDTRQLTGFEALIRWDHPKLGLLGPDKFIPVAEETGIIEQIGTWVIRQACQQASIWLAQGLAFHTLAVNVSSRQLLKGNLVTVIRDALQHFKLDACYLEVEITESSIMQEPQQAIEQLDQLRRLGVSLAIDDFGTGYSSLGQLRQIPFHHLKIDKSFIHDIGGSDSDTAITETIIAMGERMKLKVIAEGVETLEQERFLISQGCSEVQGFLYAKPKPASQIQAADFKL